MRRSKKGKVKRKSVASLKKQADKTFSIWVRKRDKGVCITCNGVGNQNGHFMSRRYSATRYHPQNNNGQCARCNVFNHGEQYKYALALDKKYGKGTAEKLALLAQTHHKFTVEELEAIIGQYS